MCHIPPLIVPGVKAQMLIRYDLWRGDGCGSIKNTKRGVLHMDMCYRSPCFCVSMSSLPHLTTIVFSFIVEDNKGWFPN